MGYFIVAHFLARRQAGSYTLSRLKACTALFTSEGESLCFGVGADPAGRSAQGTGGAHGRTPAPSHTIAAVTRFQSAR